MLLSKEGDLEGEEEYEEEEEEGEEEGEEEEQVSKASFEETLDGPSKTDNIETDKGKNQTTVSKLTLRKEKSKPSQGSWVSWGSQKGIPQPKKSDTQKSKDKIDDIAVVKKLGTQDYDKLESRKVHERPEGSFTDLLSHKTIEKKHTDESREIPESPKVANSVKKSADVKEDGKLSSERLSGFYLKSKKSLEQGAPKPSNSAEDNSIQSKPAVAQTKNVFELSRITKPKLKLDKLDQDFVLGKKDSLRSDRLALDSSQDTKDMANRPKPRALDERASPNTYPNLTEKFGLGSSRRVSFKTIYSKENGLGTPSLSKQNTITMPSISKQATPKAVESSKKIEPMKVFPLLKSSARGIPSRDQTPEVEKAAQTFKFQNASSTISPKYKPVGAKDSLKYLSNANLSKPQLKLAHISANQKENLSSTGAELSRKNSLKLVVHVERTGEHMTMDKVESVPIVQSNRRPSGIRNSNESPSNPTKIELSSRRTSTGPLAPIFGVQSKVIEPPKQMVSKQIGPGYSSLNNSKFESKDLDRSANLDVKPGRVITIANPTWSEVNSPRGVTSHTLLKSMKELLRKPEGNQFLTLEQLESENREASSLRLKALGVLSPSTSGSGFFNFGGVGQRRSMNSYTKSTMNYLKARYKKDIQTNVTITEAMEKELDRLKSLSEKVSNPQ